MPLSKIESAGLGAGTVLQVVQGTATGTLVSTSVTGANWTDTTLSASITPKFTTSKILVTVTQPFLITSPSLAYAGGGFKLLRNSTSILVPSGNSSGAYQIWSASTGTNFTLRSTFSTQYLDSPATTSAITYKTQMQVYNSSMTIYVQETDVTNATSIITLMEIAG